MKRFFNLQKLLILLLFAGSYCFSLANQSIAQDTISKNSSDTLPIKKNNLDLLNYTVKSPAIAVGLSAIIPGSGQIYTGNYVKSGIIFASELALGLFAYNRNFYADDYKKIAARQSDTVLLYKDSVSYKKDSTNTNGTWRVFIDTASGSTPYKMQYDYVKFQEQEVRLLTQQCISWAIGVYYFNIMDALKNTRFLFDTKPRNPSTAFWLSAVPGLALGQLYNGSYDKAGLIFMTQMNLAFMVYNYQTLMRKCEDNLLILSDPASRESKDPSASGLKSSWDSKRNDAFRNRNMYLWYSLGLYFYGIFDAIVDAHLHDVGTKMKLEPDLSPEQNRVGLNLRGEF